LVQNVKYRVSIVWRYYLLLVIGAVLVSLGQGGDHIPFVIVPGFALMILYNRFVGQGAAFIGIAVAYTAAWDIAYAPTMPVPMPWRLIISGGVGLCFALTFLVDRAVARRRTSVLGTLVLPAGLVSLEYLMGICSPGGTGGSLAYCLADQHLFAQLVAFTGWTGLTFLIIWLAVLVLHVGQCRSNPRFAVRTTVMGMIVVAGVMIVGWAHTSRLPPFDTVPVAAIVGRNTYDDGGTRREDVMVYLKGDKQHMRKYLAGQTFLRKRIGQQLELIERTLVQGAQIVVLPEANPVVRQQDLEYVMPRVRELAQKYNSYVGIAPYIFAEDDYEDQNTFTLIGPDGGTVLTYLKSRLVPGSHHAVGPGILPMHDVGFGRLSAAICFDLDFPKLMQQLSDQEIDILLAPAKDWSAIAELHTRMARLRAIEQGVSLLRPSEGGVTLATDPVGHTLGILDTREAGEYVMAVDVPISRLVTIYGQIGDVFSYLCIFYFLAAIVSLFRFSKVPGQAGNPTARDLSTI